MTTSQEHGHEIKASLAKKAGRGLRRQERRFNVVGPNHVELHYTVPPEPRLAAVADLARRGEYVIVEGPRLSGKTTSIRALARTVAGDGTFAVLRVSCRPLAKPDMDAVRAQRGLLDLIDRAAAQQLAPLLRPAPRPPNYDVRFVGPVLSSWARVCPKPIVLMIDDIDDVAPAFVASLLSQLDASHAARPRAAPWSVVITSSEDLGGALEVARRKTLPDFTLFDVATLCAGYTEETGQIFTSRAKAALLDHAGGHPWVVNAIAREIVERTRPPRRKPITAEHVHEAQRLLLSC